MSAPKASPAGDRVTVRQFAEQLMPDLEPEEWFNWPSDVFALTSQLLKITGLYRYAVSPHPDNAGGCCAWPDWDDSAAKTSLEWYQWILGLSDVFPEAIEKSREILFDDKNTLGPYDFHIPPETCTAIFHLHAVADTACSNMGLPAAPGIYINQVHFLANTLLGLTGTLSRLPKRMPGMPEDRTVALWRDQLTGWAPIKLEKGDESVLLTISAKWKEEFTADGRGDHGNAATFILTGRHHLRASDREKEAARADLETRQEDGARTSKSTDVLELSTMSYLVDIFMDIPSPLVRRIKSWAVVAKEGDAPAGDGAPALRTPRPFGALEERLKAGIDLFASRGREWPPAQYVYAVRLLGRFIGEENENVPYKMESTPEALESRLCRWRKMVGKARDALASGQGSPLSTNPDSEELGIEPPDVNRLNRLVYLSVLWAIHNRLENLMRDSLKNAVRKKPDFKLRASIAELLKITVECQERYSGYQ